MIRKLNLQLFAEGGEGGAGDANSGTVAESKGVLSQVRYGKTADQTPDQQESKDARARFEELIKGEYKDAFTQRTQDIIDKRFKETKVLESYRDDVSPIIDTLYRKYGVSDIQGLKDAIDNDDSYWEAEAEQEGLTVEQYKNKRKLEAENNQFRRQQEQQVRENQARQQYRQWVAEGEEVKKMYPQFDLATECQNKDFVDLLEINIQMQPEMQFLKAPAMERPGFLLTGLLISSLIQNTATRLLPAPGLNR